MKEFILPLRDAFHKGLRRELTSIRNSAGLTTSLNAVPTARGLERYFPLDSIFPELPLDWPFPQVFLTKEKTFVGMATGVYLWENGIGFTKVIDYPVQDQWTFIDFSPFYLVSHFGISWRWDLDLDTFVEIDEINTPGFPICTALENFKGQLVAGGILEKRKGVATVDNYQSRIVWGKIGNLDFTVDRRNQAGFLELPGGGTIRRITSLEKGFVVYSDRQIIYCYPVSAPVYTFGMRVLMDDGIDDYASVGKGLGEHVVLTSEGVLYQITDEGVTEIGYKEFFDDFKNYKVSVTYNSEAKEYYISNGHRTYVYRKEGLGELGQVVTSGGTEVGRFKAWASPPWSEDFLVVTDTFDMGTRGAKTLYAIEATVDTLGMSAVSVFWRAAVNQGWRQTPWFPLGPLGIATFPVAGIEFRIAFRVKGNVAVSFDTATVRWKLTDKRNIRGTYKGGPDAD